MIMHLSFPLSLNLSHSLCPLSDTLLLPLTLCSLVFCRRSRAALSARHLRLLTDTTLILLLHNLQRRGRAAEVSLSSNTHNTQIALPCLLFSEETCVQSFVFINITAYVCTIQRGKKWSQAKWHRVTLLWLWPDSRNFTQAESSSRLHTLLSHKLK